MIVFHAGVSVLLAFALCASVQAQRTWIVDACPGASRRDFVDLPPAVAAASSGDTILMVGDRACATGAHYYQAAHIDKAIAVVGLVSGGATNPYVEPGGVAVKGRITVSGIAAGQRLILANMSLALDLQVTGSNPYGLHVWDCAGEVVLEDVYMDGYAVNSRFRFDRCQDVVMHWCDIAPGSEPLTISDTQVRMVSSRIRATNGLNQWPGVFWYGTTEAIHMRNSDLLLSADCLVTGGDGTGSSGGAVAVLLESGTLRAGPGVELWGGYEGSQNPPQTRYAAGVQHHPPGTGQVFADSRAYVNRFTPQPATIHAVYHQPVIQNQTQQVFLSGPPGGFGLLAVGNAPITPWPMLQYGTLGIDPWTLQFVAAVPLPSTHGTATLTLFTSNQVPIGFPFAWQGAVIAPDGAISLTEPSTFTVAWAHGRVL